MVERAFLTPGAVGDLRRMREDLEALKLGQLKPRRRRVIGGGGGGVATDEFVLLTNVDVTVPLTVRGRRVKPTDDPAVWAVNDGEDDPGEEEFRTEFGIPAIHYKAFEWTDWRNLNGRATLLPLIRAGHLYVAQKLKFGVPEDPPNLEQWPRTECWVFG